MDDGWLSQNEFGRRIDRLMAVCRLAGRWDELDQRYPPGAMKAFAADNLAADLARLMEGCP